jgi:hypothetical protein
MLILNAGDEVSSRSHPISVRARIEDFRPSLGLGLIGQDEWIKTSWRSVNAIEYSSRYT